MSSGKTDSSTASGTKCCCSCGADVVGKKRMRDSKGRYWCMNCGSADVAKKAAATAPCHHCGKPFESSALTKVGLEMLCPVCHTQQIFTFRSKSGNSLGSGSPKFGGAKSGSFFHRNKNLARLLVVASILAVVCFWAQSHL